MCTTFVQLTLLLHHWTILCIYDATVRPLSVLFYTTVRFHASTMLLFADWQFCFIPLYVSTHLHFYGSLWVYTTVRHTHYDCTHLRLNVMIKRLRFVRYIMPSQKRSLSHDLRLRFFLHIIPSQRRPAPAFVYLARFVRALNNQA